jgi:putative transposase
MFLAGLSTRTMALMSERLIGRRISATEVSKSNKVLIRAVEVWTERDLSEESIKYIIIDGPISLCI